MKENKKAYIHLIISVILIPFIIYGDDLMKYIILAYTAYLVIKMNAESLPALAIISSYLSSFYLIYFLFIIISILKFKKIKSVNFHVYLIILLIFLPLVLVYSFFQMYVFGKSIGVSFNQFGLYLSMFSFFYGIIISGTLNKNIINTSIYALIILYLLNYANIFYVDFSFNRLTFFVIPFFVAYLGYYFYHKKKMLYKGFLLICSFGVLATAIITNLTFTIYLTSIFSLLIVIFYYKNKHRVIKNISGVYAFILIFVMMIYSLATFREYDFSDYDRNNLTEINLFEDIRIKAQMKLFDDRAPIWSSVWNNIVNNPNLLPPFEIGTIQIVRTGEEDKEFDYHSHNLYLEFLRTNGIVMGFGETIIFVMMILSSRRLLIVKNVYPLLIILTSTAISTMIIGGMTGIYVLISTFAPFVFTILGISHTLSYKKL